MKTKMMKTLDEVQMAPRPIILRTRQFRRNANLGMQVWRSATRNFDYDIDIEHVVLGCPQYKLTDRGPVFDRKTKEETEDES